MRTTKGAARNKAKRRLFKRAKGYRGGRGKLLRSVKETLVRAGVYAYRDRRVRKREFRKLWIVRINAAVRERGMRYSEFIHGLNLAGVELDRKALSEIAIADPAAFDAIVEQARQGLQSAPKPAPQPEPTPQPEPPAPVQPEPPADPVVAQQQEDLNLLEHEWKTKTRKDEELGVLYNETPQQIDDLKQISGVANVLEGKLHEFGVFTFRQVLEWDAEQMSEFSARLSFKDRIQRDNWQGQAKEFYEKKYGELPS